MAAGDLYSDSLQVFPFLLNQLFPDGQPGLKPFFYYADNYEPFKEFVSNLCNENEAIKKVKEILRHKFVPQHLSFIANNFKILTSAIKKLEGRLPLVDAISIVNDVHLQLPRGVYHSKLDDVLKNNPAFETLSSYAEIMSGKNVSGFATSPSQILMFKNAPVVSVEVERRF